MQLLLEIECHLRQQDMWDYLSLYKQMQFWIAKVKLNLLNENQPLLKLGKGGII